MKKFLLILCILVLSGKSQSQTFKALFDTTKNEAAGNADWVIDSHAPIPSPAQSGITQSTAESYWLGAISAWGIDLVKHGFTVHSLTTTYGITYGNQDNPYDLSNYNLFIVCEPQILFTTSEKQALKSFVQNGGGLMMVADHDGSDRDNNGYDSPKVWNDLRADSLFGIHFQSTGEANNNISEVDSNVAAGSDPLINGSAGIVKSLSYHNGTTMTILPSVNPNVAGHIWMNGVSHGTSQITFATSRYGSGKVAGVGDSSPADDGSARPKNSSIFPGWNEVGATDNIVFLNACLWLVTSDSSSFTITVSAGSNGLISPSGAVSVSNGGSQAFTITPATGYHVDSVLVDGSNAGAVTGYTFTGVIASHSIRAVFAINKYQITATAGANGSISPSGSVNVNYGSSQSFTITPSAGYHVSGVLVDGGSAGTVTSYNFANVTANHTISASFAINTYTISTSVSGNGAINPAGSVSVNYGADTSFIVTSATGFHIDSVMVDGINQPDAAGQTTYHYSFDSVITNHTISGTFAINMYSLTTGGTNGTVTRQPDLGVYSYGSSVQLTPVPSSGFVFSAWSGNVSTGHNADNPLSVTVDSAMTITASFLQGAFTLTINAQNGSVLRNPDQATYDSGSVVQLTGVNATGYHFTGWTGDTTASANPLGVVMNASKSITAHFAPDSSVITAVSGLHGTIVPAGSILVANGSNQRFVFQPDPGYRTDSLAVDGVLFPDSTAGYTFDSVSAAHSIRVSFAPATVSLPFHLNRGWNLVSLPLVVPDPRVETLFPTATTKAFRYTGQYQLGDSLYPGTGYWIKFPAAKDTTISGVGIIAESVQVHVGWNLIGSATTPIAGASITSEPPGLATGQFFGYGTGYSTADTLVPGKGYWVKAGASGMLILNSTFTGSPASKASARIRISKKAVKLKKEGMNKK